MKKKTVRRALGVLCAVFLAIVLVENLRYEARIIDYTELSRAELLRKMPEAVVTEADLAVEAALLELPEVQTLAETEYPVSFSLDLAAEAVGGLIPQDAEVLDLSGSGDYLLFTYQQGRVQTTYQFTLDGGKGPYKLTKVSSRTWYEAMPDGTYRENTMKRDWLYFLKG